MAASGAEHFQGVEAINTGGAPITHQATPSSASTVGAAGLTLRANFKWTFAGNMVNAACQWGIVAALTKLGSAAQVGQYTLGLAVAAPVLAITMLQLRAVQATDARDEFSFEHYFGTRIVTTALAMLILAGICLFAFDATQTAWIVLFVGLVKCVESVSEVVRGLFQRHERMDISGTSLMIKGPAALVALAGVYVVTRNLVWAVAAAMIAGGVVLFIYDLPKARRLLAENRSDGGPARSVRPTFDFGLIFRLVRRAWPLGLGMCLLSLQMNIPRYILQAYHGEEQLGYFSAMAYITVLGTMVVSALGQAASPRLAKYFGSDLKAFQRLIVKLIVVGIVLAVVFIATVAVAGRSVLTILYRPDYAAFQSEFVLIAVAGGVTFLVSSFGFALTAARSFKAQLWIAGAACLVSVGVAAWLVPLHGIRGAAWTLVVTAGFVLVSFAAALVAAMRKRFSTGAGGGNSKAGLG